MSFFSTKIRHIHSLFREHILYALLSFLETQLPSTFAANRITSALLTRVVACQPVRVIPPLPPRGRSRRVSHTFHFIPPKRAHHGKECKDMLGAGSDLSRPSPSTLLPLREDKGVPPKGEGG